MPSRRWLWLGVGAVAYVCFAALESARDALWPLVGLLALTLLLVEVWRRTERSEPGEYRIEPAARSALRACFWGAALWAAARTGTTGRSALDAAANLGAGVCAVAGLVALARIASLGGLLVPHPSTRSLDAALFAAVLWGIAVALPATRALVTSANILLDPLAIDYATTTAGVGSLLVLVAATWRLRFQRRLEIGVADRAAGALALSMTALLVALPASAADIAPPDRVLPVAVIAGSMACCWAATTREPTTVSIALRGILAIMILGVPTTLMVAVAAREAPKFAGPIALGGCLLSIVVGLIARAVARPLGPEQSRWLQAIEEASRGALQPEPDAAIRAALMAMRGTASTPDAHPELWQADPPEVLSIDVAGYLRIESGQAPARLYEIALAEPERTLRAEVLAALPVRRPDIRPLLAWFETRRAFSATLIVDEDGPLGFILLPKGRRQRVLSLEEARAVRLLSDRLSALISVSSALARSRQRQMEAQHRSDELESECRRLETILARDDERHRSYAALLARPVQKAAYSAATRLVIDEIERAARTRGAFAMEVPIGVDAGAWAALAHLAGPRHGGPFVTIDATASEEHDVARWQDDSRSPIVTADGGTLLLVDAAALPLAVQDAIAELMVQRVGRPSASSVQPTGIVLTVRAPLEQLIAAGRLSRALATLCGPEAITLPTLAERPEDLRGIILDQLAALGLRLHGEPFGIEPAALQALLDHSWPGNELELRDVVSRAAANSAGTVVSLADLSGIGFISVPEAPPLPSPLPNSSRRRPRALRGVRRR